VSASSSEIRAEDANQQCRVRGGISCSGRVDRTCHVQVVSVARKRLMRDLPTERDAGEAGDAQGRAVEACSFKQHLLQFYDDIARYVLGPPGEFDGGAIGPAALDVQRQLAVLVHVRAAGVFRFDRHGNILQRQVSEQFTT
jgi:hypothetical protein